MLYTLCRADNTISDRYLPGARVTDGLKSDHERAIVI